MRQYGGYTSRRDNQGYQRGYSSRSSHNLGYSQAHQKREYQYIRPYNDNNYNRNRYSNNNHNNHINQSNRYDRYERYERHDRYDRNSRNSHNSRNGHNDRHSHSNSHSNSHSHHDRYDRQSRSSNSNNNNNNNNNNDPYLDDKWQGVWEISSRGATNGNLMIVQFEMDRKNHTRRYTLINQKWDTVSQLYPDPKDSMTAHMTDENKKYNTTRNYVGKLIGPPFDTV